MMELCPFYDSLLGSAIIAIEKRCQYNFLICLKKGSDIWLTAKAQYLNNLINFEPILLKSWPSYAPFLPPQYQKINLVHKISLEQLELNSDI